MMSLFIQFLRSPNGNKIVRICDNFSYKNHYIMPFFIFNQLQEIFHNILTFSFVYELNIHIYGNIL